ncbi:MAG: type II toxin-antitoxin system RelE/ParE family toxin [Candidatus Omnitrophota bacterium]
MPWDLFYTKRANRDLLRIPYNERQIILHSLEKVIVDFQISDIKKLSGRKNEWRIRVGKWRAILQFNYEDGIIRVLRILPRKDAYRD